MARLNILVAVLFMQILPHPVNAQVDHFHSGIHRIDFKLRRDLIFVESTDSLRLNRAHRVARSVVSSARDFTIIEIDTLRTNAERVARNIDVTNTAYVLEYADGTLQIPTSAIFVSPRQDISMETTLEELKKNEINVISIRPLYESSNILVVELEIELNNVLETVSRLSENPLFEFVEPNFMRLVRPSNTYFGNQWGLRNIGQSGGTAGVDIRAVNAWNITRGAGIRVAVLGDGIQTNHPDLNANVLWNLGRDMTIGATGGSGGSSHPLDFHETACAGIIAALDNNIGIVGVAPEAKIIPIRIGYGVTPGIASHWRMYDSLVALGIRHAWQNADILSNSWQMGSSNHATIQEINTALIHGRNGRGSIVVFSAGNNNSPNVNSPANSNSNIIAVGAMSSCGERKSPSSCDGETWWGSNYGALLDVVAPGVLVPTTSVATNNPPYTLSFNGTSAAAPHVAGVAALILSINPNLTQRQVADIIESTARKVGNYNYQATSGRPNGTWNNQMGYGLVDAEAAVKRTICTLPSVTLTGIINTDRTVSGSTVNVQNATLRINRVLTINACNQVNIDGDFTVERYTDFFINFP